MRRAISLSLQALPTPLCTLSWRPLLLSSFFNRLWAHNACCHGGRFGCDRCAIGPALERWSATHGGLEGGPDWSFIGPALEHWSATLGGLEGGPDRMCLELHWTSLVYWSATHWGLVTFMSFCFEESSLWEFGVWRTPRGADLSVEWYNNSRET